MSLTNPFPSQIGSQAALVKNLRNISHARVTHGVGGTLRFVTYCHRYLLGIIILIRSKIPKSPCCAPDFLRFAESKPPSVQFPPFFEKQNPECSQVSGKLTQMNVLNDLGHCPEVGFYCFKLHVHFWHIDLDNCRKFKFPFGSKDVGCPRKFNQSEHRIHRYP